MLSNKAACICLENKLAQQPTHDPLSPNEQRSKKAREGIQKKYFLCPTYRERKWTYSVGSQHFVLLLSIACVKQSNTGGQNKIGE